MDEELVKMIRMEIFKVLQSLSLNVSTKTVGFGDDMSLEVSMSIRYKDLSDEEKDLLGAYPRTEYESEYGSHNILGDSTTIS
jgi:hypothetical protein